jgi:membrane complex biogenesis BtpA family protein
MSRFTDLFPRSKPLIAVCHLPPLPDYPDSPGIDALCAHALADLATVESIGLDAILIENEYDRPHRVKAQPETVDAMTRITASVCAAASSAIVGCEILLNDPEASLDVAKATGARFIRSDYFVDRMSRADYGEFEIDPVGLLDYRKAKGAKSTLILADVQVKFATMVEKRSLQESARLAALRGADGVVVTGDETGTSPTANQLREARAGINSSGRDVPLLLGSGLDTDNAFDLLGECDGAIVGTALMRKGRIDAERAQRLVSEADKHR